MSFNPHVVVLSGSLGAGSRSERLARWCAEECLRYDATSSLFVGADLNLPFYQFGTRRGPAALRLLSELERADGVVLVSPSYHGSVSGLLKNALDYINDLATDERPFLDGRSVGCVSLAAGAQGASSTLAAMRAIVHALRGWPTPLGVAVQRPLDISAGKLAGDDAGALQLSTLVGQVVTFARMQSSPASLVGHAEEAIAASG